MKIYYFKSHFGHQFIFFVKSSENIISSLNFTRIYKFVYVHHQQFLEFFEMFYCFFNFLFRQEHVSSRSKVNFEMFILFSRIKSAVGRLKSVLILFPSPFPFPTPPSRAPISHSRSYLHFMVPDRCRQTSLSGGTM